MQIMSLENEINKMLGDLGIGDVHQKSREMALLIYCTFLNLTYVLGILLSYFIY